MKKILIGSKNGKTTHILKKEGKHGFYGEGVFTICGKHIKKEYTYILPKIIGRKCKFCFFKPKVTWIRRKYD